MYRSLQLGIFMVLAAGCDQEIAPPIIERPTIVHMNVKRYLALGDSYTIGEAVSQEQSFPFQLSTALKAGGETVVPTVIARTGWTTGELIQAIPEYKPSGTYDLVTLLIGVNNQYRGMDQAIYKREFAALLDQAIGFAGGKTTAVKVVSIPDWGVTEFGKKSGRNQQQISSEIDAYNLAAKEIATSKKVQFIDITPGSRRAVSEPALIASDGLHPSGLMYREWAVALLPHFASQPGS